MGQYSVWLHSICLFFFFVFCLSSSLSSSSSSSNLSSTTSNDYHLCPYHQSLALLQLKQSFTINRDYASPFCDVSNPRTMLWNGSSSDCCTWDGVECDEFTGDVVGLDLMCSMLQGPIHSNSTLFQLSHLKSLSLANNKLEGPIPTSFTNLGKLRSLYLRGNNFNGQFPTLIFNNLTQLEDLNLSDNELEGLILGSLTNPTQLLSLDLSYNKLEGRIPTSLSNLTQLVSLDLSYNKLEGPIPSSLTKLGKLRSLKLQKNNFSDQFPTLIFDNLTQLEELDLSYNSLTGPLPPNSSELPNLFSLDLSQNSLNGAVPSWLFSLPSLLSLDISSNRLQSIGEFSYSPLQTIDLSNNQLHGTIPKSIEKLVNLTELYLSSNNLSGVVESEMFLNLKELQSIDLSYNSNLSFSTNDNNVNTTLPNLNSFIIASCKITEFPKFLRYSENLRILDLSNNNIEGQIPKWAQSVWRDSLWHLNLSHNFLTSLPQEIPWKNLEFLDLRSNLLEGPLFVPSSPGMRYLFMSNNKLTGEISSLICKSSDLLMIDLSNNSLTGVIPQCLANFNDFLIVLNLRMNGFVGTIPDTFSEGIRLMNLDLYGNQLEGRVPLSLKNCTQLEVLDLGNNNITDTFPHWLGSLPNLQVLIFKSNRFHGPITTPHTKLFFPMLRIIDLSHNEFTGHFPTKYFEHFKAMMNVNDSKMELEYMGDGYDMIRGVYYRDSVGLMIKGSDIELLSISTVFTAIDLSSNKFKGEIPKLIGDLNSLRLLNLSHNNLTGHIPPSMGNMKKLEALDLSSNQLVGEIPEQLTSLIFLEVLNLSQNHLEGQIPTGKQFDTFQNDSYSGNLALCGLPLSKSCRDDELPLPPPSNVFPNEDDSKFFGGFTWKSVVMGYSCGIVFGLVMGCTTFLIAKPKWFVGIVEREQHKRGKRPKKSVGRGRVGRRLT